MTNTIQNKIIELRAQLIDTSVEDTRIKSLESDLNNAVNSRNEKLRINNDLNAKIQKLLDVQVLISEEE